ncbi:hypothetical protein P4493_05670 [Bacillus thuringiensis]|uniref:Uncharacterized protein n=3 Tax=Bacillus thuringiensis TaxID=1428 RepID=A0A0B5NIW8_BACTU|nr:MULTISPECIES: hypothetical protein [Bacillus]EAO56501.1 hypothetical protein RBTH_07549 [Bacillus thuringiensis serovar israelensis ATCC 35646]MEC2534109.1 hypothetical protein [Bacillus cereus]MED1153970.1 hypothetical protein [Bacillus paranthracis]OUB09192.1 hypothetical protein BK708_32155 [Bacillus thuringiensis serovar yunnanensis]AFQ29842.1 hypothetical protein BTF1_28707 [Bacillus thuringiensis HD-789]
MSDSVILKPKETMVQLKKDHEVLGEEDTLFCVLGTAFNIKTDESNILLAKIVENDGIADISEEFFTVEGVVWLESYFDIVQNTTFLEHQIKSIRRNTEMKYSRHDDFY